MFDVARFRSGDEECLRYVMQEYSGLVLMVCQAFAIDFDHAQDLFQETWIKVYERASSYEGRGSIRAWVYRVAKNVCLSDYRNRRSTAEGLARYAVEAAPSDPSWRRADPLFDSHQRELHRVIHRELARLADAQLQALTLRIVDGRKPKEVAQIMGIDPATVRSHVRHAMNRLKRLAEEPDSELSRHRADY